jgi:chromosome condensin MukBEF MukE localization factor
MVPDFLGGDKTHESAAKMVQNGDSMPKNVEIHLQAECSSNRAEQVFSNLNFKS